MVKVFLVLTGVENQTGPRNGRMLRETIQGHTTYWRYYRQGRSRRRRCFAIHEVRLSTDLLVDMFT